MAKDINFKQPFQNGDFNITFSDDQHIEHLMVSAPGHFKNAPLLGVRITDYINASLPPSEQQKLERLVRLNLESDGATQINTRVDNIGNVDVDAEYR